MKKIQLNKKLQLNKETVANLNNDQMNNINGGGVFSWFGATCQQTLCKDAKCTVVGVTCGSNTQCDVSCNSECICRTSGPVPRAEQQMVAE